MRRLLLFLMGATLCSGTAWGQKEASPARAALVALLAQRDQAVTARDAGAYFATCAPDYVELDPQEDSHTVDSLRTTLKKTLTAADTAEQKTEIDTFQPDGDGAVVETYERIKRRTLLHEWLEVTTSGYRRCRYRAVQQNGHWHLARGRLREETLQDVPRLLPLPGADGLGQLETRVTTPEVRDAVRTVFPLLQGLATAEERKDFSGLRDTLAADFTQIRLGQDPDDRTTYLQKMVRAHQFIQEEKVRYYLVGGKLRENGELVLEVQQGLQYRVQAPDSDPRDTILIVNLVLTWTHQGGTWCLRRYENFTVEGFENGKRVDFIQKQKEGKGP